MKLSKLETLILSDTSDDYESIGWLTEGRGDEVGFSVDEALVTECLRRMASEGLVDVFHYDPNNSKQEFVPTSFSERKPVGELWFYITAKGREVVRKNWDESWTEETWSASTIVQCAGPTSAYPWKTANVCTVLEDDALGTLSAAAS